MIRDFGFNEDSVGILSGLLTATFAICQFVSSYFWGSISDKYGRKISLLIGSIFSGFGIIMFGMSTSYGIAIAARCIAGIFNGNIGVARAYVADITNGKNRAFAFSIFAIAFSAGIVAGSTCGGSLIHTYELRDDGTHRLSEGVLEWWIFHTEFPYLLPCLIGSFISFFSFGMTMIYIHDVDKTKRNKGGTNKRSTSKNYNGYSNGHNGHKSTGSQDIDRSRSLPMVSMDGVSSMEMRHKYSMPEMSSHSLSRYDHLKEDLAASIIEGNTMGTNALFEGFKAMKSNEGENGALLEQDEFNEDDEDPWNPKIDSLTALFKKTRIIHALVINATIMVMLVAWNAMVPLLLAQILEMDSFAIGVYMAYNGVVLFVFTWYIQPILIKKINYKTLYIGFGTGMLIVILAFPTLTKIPGINDWDIVPLVVLTSFVGAFKYAFSCNLFVVSLCFINNSVPPQAMGRANGLAQAFGSGLRGLGPLLGGALWSWSITLEDKWWAVYIAYIFMWIPSAYSVFHCICFINRSIQKTWTERAKEQKQT